MNRMLLMASTLTISVVLSISCLAEHLDILYKDSIVIDSSEYYDYMGSMSVLLVKDDTTLFGCGSGLYGKFNQGESWMRLLPGYVVEKAPYFSNCNYKRRNSIYWPQKMWIMEIGESNEKYVYDRYCSILYSVHIYNNESYLEIWEKKDTNVHLEQINIQNNIFIEVSLLFNSNGSIICYRKNGLKIRSLFNYPQPLKYSLDSIGFTGGNYRIYPNINPVDSTMWIAVNGYDYIYIVSMEGLLVDSLQITNPDFRLPPKLKSRMHTQAVWKEWSSQWTPIYDFVYVNPGYFILSFRKDSVQQAIKQVWDVDGKVVDIDIDRHWRILGVQPDGRIIFGFYEDIEGDVKKRKYIYYVTRIEP